MFYWRKPVKRSKHCLKEIFRFKSAPHLKVENRPLFEDVVEKEFEEGCDLSQKFGPTWATHWFKLDFSTAVPGMDFGDIFIKKLVSPVFL